MRAVSGIGDCGSGQYFSSDWQSADELASWNYRNGTFGQAASYGCTAGECDQIGVSSYAEMAAGYSAFAAQRTITFAAASGTSAAASVSVGCCSFSPAGNPFWALGDAATTATASWHFTVPVSGRLDVLSSRLVALGDCERLAATAAWALSGPLSLSDDYTVDRDCTPGEWVRETSWQMPAGEYSFHAEFESGLFAFAQVFGCPHSASDDAHANANFFVFLRYTPNDDCLGDLDGDGDIDQGDLGILLGSLGSSIGDSNYNPDLDFDGDGDVDQADLGVVLARYGQPC